MGLRGAVAARSARVFATCRRDRSERTGLPAAGLRLRRESRAGGPPRKRQVPRPARGGAAPSREGAELARIAGGASISGAKCSLAIVDADELETGDLARSSDLQQP
jgi:hypothetical protein